MRRKDRERGVEFALEVIDACEYGTVAFQGEEPYCLPLSLVREGEELYFHCALEGKKLERLRSDPRVCVSFVSHNQAAQDDFTTYFRSAVVMGTASEVTRDEEKIAALRVLCEKLTPACMDDFQAAVARSLSVTGIWKIHMDEIVGKEKRRPLK